MNFKNIGWYFILGLLLFSCKKPYTQDKTILLAESMLNSSPDSAYSILNSIHHPKALPEADYAAWCLHYTHAQYKLQLQIKSDSLIRVANTYYSKSDLPVYNGTASYLFGCISRKLGNNKTAIFYLKRASNILKETNENNLKGLVNFNIAYLYTQDDLFNESLLYFNKSLLCFGESKNLRYQAYSYRGIADVYYQLNLPFDSVMHYVGLAIKLSKDSHDSINYYSNLSRKGELLYDNDSIVQSKDFLLAGFTHNPSERSKNAAFLSVIYSKLHKVDSASYYYNISLTDSLNSNKTLLNLAGAYLTKSEGKKDEAFHYLEKAYTIRDSVSQRSMQNQLYRIDKQYDLAQKEKENDQLKITNRTNILWINLLIIIVLVVLIILLLINRRHKKEQSVHDMEKQKMEFEIETRKIENARNEELLLSKLHNKIGNTLQFNRLGMGSSQADKLETFLKEITKQSVISEKEKEYYINEVNHLFDGRISELPIKHELLTSSDLIVIALICLKVDISDSCILLNMTTNTMYVRRKRIKKHIGLLPEENLENWILENVVQTS